MKKLNSGIKIVKCYFPLFVKKVNFGIKIVEFCFPLLMKTVIFGVNITKISTNSGNDKIPEPQIITLVSLTKIQVGSTIYNRK